MENNPFGEPTHKAQPIVDFLEVMAGRSTAIREGRCVDPPVGCGRKVEVFEDARSAREYQISGLCQQCQNEIFDRS